LEDQREEYYRQLQAAITAEQWEEAVALARFIPGYRDVPALQSRAALAWASQRRREGTYGKLLEALQQESWDKAVLLARQIPGYRDADELRGKAERHEATAGAAVVEEQSAWVPVAGRPGFRQLRARLASRPKDQTQGVAPPYVRPLILAILVLAILVALFFTVRAVLRVFAPASTGPTPTATSATVPAATLLPAATATSMAVAASIASPVTPVPTTVQPSPVPTRVPPTATTVPPTERSTRPPTEEPTLVPTPSAPPRPTQPGV
jgi:hypothetical protein